MASSKGVRFLAAATLGFLLVAGCSGAGPRERDVADPAAPTPGAGSPDPGPGEEPSGQDPGPTAGTATAWWHPLGGGPPLAAGEAPAFRFATVPGTWGWEPSVDVDASGAIYYAAAVNTTSGDQAVRVLRSRDSGATWDQALPGLPDEVPPNRFTNDPFLAVDPITDRLFAGHMRVECNTLHWSDDGGDTWTTNPIGCGHPFEDRPMMWAGPLATPAGPAPDLSVLYLCSNQVVVSTCSRSLDGGATFQATAPPFAGDPSCAPVMTGFLSTNGAASPVDGAAYVARWTTCGLVTVARTGDNGATWSHSALETGPRGNGCAADTMLAVDAAGTVHLAFLDAACLPVLASSADGGATWSAPASVARPGLAKASHLALAAGDAGKVALSYMGTSDPTANGTARPWHLHVAFLQDATAPGSPVVTVDAAGRPLVAGPSAGGAGLGAGLSGVGDFLDLAVDRATGRVVAAAVDVCKGACVPPEGDPPLGRAAIAVQTAGPGLR